MSRTSEFAVRTALTVAVLGTLGLASPTLLDRYDLQTPLAVAELDAAPLLALYPPHREAGELPRLPAVERDLSLIVDETTPWQAIESAIHTADPAYLEALEFVGTYRGKPIAPGKKSLSLRLRFRHPHQTLTTQAVDTQITKTLDALTPLGAELRQ